MLTHSVFICYIDKLRGLENESVNRLTALRRGLNAARPPPPATVRADERLKVLTARLDRGAYTPLEFLEAASHHLDNVHNDLANLNGEEEEEEDDVMLEGLVPAWLPPDPEQPQIRRGAVRGRGQARPRRAARGGRGRGRGDVAIVEGGAAGRGRRGRGRGRARGNGRRRRVSNHLYIIITSVISNDNTNVILCLSLIE